MIWLKFENSSCSSIIFQPDHGIGAVLTSSVLRNVVKVLEVEHDDLNPEFCRLRLYGTINDNFHCKMQKGADQKLLIAVDYHVFSSSEPLIFP
jgi:hypothetical protein